MKNRIVLKWWLENDDDENEYHLFFYSKIDEPMNND